MQQVPATTKTRRWWNLTLATLGILRPSFSRGLKASEYFALKLRGKKRSNISRASQVVFLLPLVKREQVNDWFLVESNLNKTLKCFLRQTNPNWIAIICGHEKPNIPNDKRIHFLEFKTATSGNDKWAKLAELVNFFPKVAQPSGYVMTFDADDLAHCDLVKIFLKNQHPNGYLIDHGIIHDIAAGNFGQAGTPTICSPLRKPFWKLCGSCATFRYDQNEHKLLQDFIRATSQHEHRMFPYLASLAGRPLHKLGENLVIYEFNHGENFGLRRKRGKFKSQFAKRFKINDASILNDLTKNFN